MNTKKLFTILTLFMICFTAYQITSTYALFESKISGVISPAIGKWNIYVNGDDVTSGATKSFVMDKFNIGGSKYTEEGKIAPGMKGSFEISILPKDTQVSIRYDIAIDSTSVDANQIKLVAITEKNNKNTIIRTGENTYTAVILLEDISEDYRDDIEIFFTWDDNEDNNEKDTAIGTVYNSKISMPITIKLSQYLGETIEVYTD